MSMKKNVIVPILPTRRDVRFHLPVERIVDWHDAAGPVLTTFISQEALLGREDEDYNVALEQIDVFLAAQQRLAA